MTICAFGFRRPFPFFFTFRSFLYNFTHDNSIHVSSTWRVGKISVLKSVRNTEFISKQPWQFFVLTCMSLQLKLSVCHCILIKLCCLIPFLKYQSLTLATLEVKYVWYLNLLPIYCLFSFLGLFASNSQ